MTKKTKPHPPISDWLSALDALSRFLVRISALLPLNLLPTPRARRRMLTRYDHAQATNARIVLMIAGHGAAGFGDKFAKVAFTDEDRATAHYWLDNDRLAEAIAIIADRRYRAQQDQAKRAHGAPGPVMVAEAPLLADCSSRRRAPAPSKAGPTARNGAWFGPAPRASDSS